MSTIVTPTLMPLDVIPGSEPDVPAGPPGPLVVHPATIADAATIAETAANCRRRPY